MRLIQYVVWEKFGFSVWRATESAAIEENLGLVYMFGK